MTLKAIFVVWTLAISTVGLAMAGSSSFTLATPAMIGTHKLKPGGYEVNVKKDQAVITNNEDGKSFSVPVKIEQGDKKFYSTTVSTKTNNGADEISEIDLGGSTTRVVFGQ